MYNDRRELVPHPFDKCEQSHIVPMDPHCICGRGPDDEIHKVVTEEKVA
jgi:hypothetical protein